MMTQIGRLPGYSPCIQIGRAGAEHTTDFSDLHHVQGAVWQLRNPHGDIDALLDEPDHTIEQQKADMQARIAPDQLGDDRQDVQPPEHDGRGDRQRPARAGPAAPCGFEGIIDLGQPRATSFQKLRPFIRQADAARGPCQQGDADGRFERGDRPRDRRR